MTVTRETLITAARNAAGVSEADAKMVVDEALAIIGDTLAAHEEVKIHSFGSFYPRWRKGGSGRTVSRNNKTTEEIKFPGRWRISFKPSNELKASLNIR